MFSFQFPMQCSLLCLAKSQVSLVGSCKDYGASTPCCYTKNIDSLKSWNNHFCWIDASVYPISIPWFEGVFVKKGPLPSDDFVDFPLLERLNEGRATIRKYPESSNPFKVKTRERTLRENEVPLRETEDKKARDSSFAVPSEQNPTTTGKTPAALEKLVIQSGQ
ncbi:hypothetical protein Tco_0627280 [Tanacetum coccineum]|uniref:Uncharacterized protein n=1 Tax=Tanacetum coccineum TaxID=301880 RepID=A0ABQ4WM80_9ASTR